MLINDVWQETENARLLRLSTLRNDLLLAADDIATVLNNSKACAAEALRARRAEHDLTARLGLAQKEVAALRAGMFLAP